MKLANQTQSPDRQEPFGPLSKDRTQERREFCTYFDQHYLARGMAMYESLQIHCQDFRLWVLCLDDICYETLLSLGRSNISPVRLGALENEDGGLRNAKNNRSIVEYYFTCTPCFPLFVFEHAKDVNLLTYLDSDLFFFSSPSPLFDEIDNHSIAIIEHRFPKRARNKGQFGRFNVGWISFRRDREGLACLRLWREQCLESCSDHVTEGRFADQKYLDDWPSRFAQLRILGHKGANLAPWNIENYEIDKRDGRLCVDDDPLLFFHFHGLREVRRCVYETSLDEYGVGLSVVVARKIYGPYIDSLTRIKASLLHGNTAVLGVGVRTKRADSQSVAQAHEPLSAWQRSVENARAVWRFGRNVVTGRYLIVWNGLVLSFGRQRG